MQAALNKITIPLLRAMKYGDEVQLPEGYSLYHYYEDDSIVLGKNYDGYFAEILAILFDDLNIEYHVLNEEFLEINH